MQACPFCGNDQNRNTATFCTRCGGALPGLVQGLGTGQLQPQVVLRGRYTIVGRVGQGGMGAVYKVGDLHIPGKVWALKELSDAALATPDERAQAVAAFQQEAQLLATLRHPNLPQVIDYFSEGGRHYLVMDFVPGETLDAVASRSAPLPEGQVLGWAAQLCDVLTYLHRQPRPIIFRDLKPGNVIVGLDGQLKLIDFGIARFFKPGQQSDTQAIGTEGYAPPEQYGRGQTDVRSDIYSLGVLLHELLTGNNPAQTPFHLSLARHLNPALSLHVEKAIVRATALNPADRFASAEEMKQSLLGGSTASVTASFSGPAPSPAPKLQSRPSRLGARRLPRAVPVLVAVVSLIGVIGAWTILDSHSSEPTARPGMVTGTAAAAAIVPASTPVPRVPSSTATRIKAPAPTLAPTATRPPSPAPTRTGVEAAVADVIWRYVDLKARAMGHWETDELDTVLRGGALSTQLGSVNWLRENNSHWEYDLHSMSFDRFEHLAGGTIRVLATKVETGRYYHQGSTTPSDKKSYYDYRYEIWYELEKIGEKWYITNIDL